MPRGKRSLAVLLPAAAGLSFLASGGLGATFTSTVAKSSACAVAPGPLSYNWPVKPFDVAHPVRGNFGDPRTVYADAGKGAFSFHNGVDITAPDGSPVYPVVSGVVKWVGPEEIVVAAGTRSFQYWHLLALVKPGDRVRRGVTVLGFIRAGAHHVHLTEIRDAIVQNPLAPGHLTPYADSIPPTVRELLFTASDGTALAPDRLDGPVDIAADAFDRPSLPVTGAWRGVPVTPAALTWKVTNPLGAQVVPERVAIDFRSSEPEDDSFWQIYAHGTYQNFPVMGRRYLAGTPGRYLFDLTPQPLDTKALPAGPYVVTVTAYDVCGNTGTLSEPIVVLPHPEPGPPPLPPPPPAIVKAPPPQASAQPRPNTLSAWPKRYPGYTVALASLPRAAGAAAARVAARHAMTAGLPRVGVLLSTWYTSLRPGYWVVFSGVYASAGQAAAAARAAAFRYPGATPRPVVPRIRVATWAPARAGYTIVLASLPKSAGLPAARAEAQRAAAEHLAGVGVLNSNRFSSLAPGYYVVFCGTYRTGDQAQKALSRIARVYPGAYARAIDR